MIRDLSVYHKPVSDLFHSLAAVDLNSFRLTEDEIASYYELGYVVGPRILTDEQVEALREELQRLMDPDFEGNHLFYEFHTNESGDPDNVLFHALGAWRILPGFHDLLWHPGFTVPASQLLGGSVRFWHDQLFCKPALHGGVVAWHQDYSYWTRTKPLAHLTCWIGLDDSTVDNGCVHYIPGSHRWELLPITGLAGDMAAIRKVLTDEQWQVFQNPTPVELRCGECVFHHPLTIHGSFENRTEIPRRAAIINSFRDGVWSDQAEPMLAGVPAIQPGKKMEGQFFPLLLESSDVASALNPES